MRIGIVTTWFERGAAYVSRQFRDVLKEQHEVFIYARGGELYAEGDAKWDTPDVTWARRSYNPKATAFQLSDFKRWVEHHALELVFFNEQHWWKPVVLCAKMGIKTGSYVDYYTEQTLPFFGLYDFLVCCTRRHASAFDWHPQAYLVPWGTDIDLFQPTAPGPVDPEALTFFHSCGWDPFRKGTAEVLRAFAALEGPCKLVLHTQVPLEDDVKEIPGVEVVHSTVSAPGLFHRGDVYVYPSKIEGVGLTLAEALASGLAVITTDHPPMSEFLDDSFGWGVQARRLYSRRDGYYWPMCEVDEASLLQAMQKAVDFRAEIADRKAAARKFAVEQLDWKQNSASIPELFAQSAIRNDHWKQEALTKIHEADILWEVPIGQFVSQIPPLIHLLRMIVRLRQRARDRGWLN